MPGVGLSNNYLNTEDTAIPIQGVTVTASKTKSGTGFSTNFLPLIDTIANAGPNWITAIKGSQFQQQQNQNLWSLLGNQNNGNNQQASIFSNPIAILLGLGLVGALIAMLVKGGKK